MTLFLLMYFGIYGGANAYVVVKFCGAFGIGGLKALLPAAFVLFMVLGPIFVRVLEHRDAFAAARLTAWVTYSWMAMAMWYVFLLLALDVWTLGAKLVSMLQHEGGQAFIPAARPAFAVVTAIVAVLSICGMLANRRLKLEQFTIRTPRMHADAQPLRIVHITDLHLGLLVRDKMLTQLVDRIRQIEPDVIVCTGDLVDAGGDHLDELVDLLASLKPPLGKFAVLGNHEYYAGLQRSIDFHNETGFHLLRAEYVILRDDVRIAGVDDIAGKQHGSECRKDEDAVLPAAGPREFTVLLKHRPVIEETSRNRFDLMLTGHTHAGQIFPFNLFVRLVYRDIQGLRQLPEGGQLYVGRGTGTWGPPMRLFASREITLFIIEPEG